jgi:hypothetical protein
MAPTPLLLSLVSLLLFAPRPAIAEPSCRVIDLMPQFFSVLDRSSHEDGQQKINDFRRSLVRPFGDLYGDSGVGFPSAPELDQAILKALANAREQGASLIKAHFLLRQKLDEQIGEITRDFPDFSCNFPIYLLPALGKLDGAGRVINGKPALLLGVDNIAAEYSAETLPIFLTHELFHRYHFQVAGFSDDKGDKEILWRSLWTEGLATYMSKSLNPRASMQDALILPKNLVDEAAPELPDLICRLMPHLDSSDPNTFRLFFMLHPDRGDIPPRVGYYIGALAASRIAEKESLSSIAHMKPEQVRSELEATLMTFTGCKK